MQRRSPAKRSTIRATILAAAAVSALPGIAQAQTSSTWNADVGLGGGNWSTPGNWVNNVVPDGGGTATFLTLPTFTTAPVTVFQDQPNITLSSLTYDSFITYLVRSPVASPGNSLTLTSPATIDVVRPSINTISITFFGHQMQLPIAGSAGLTKTGPGTLSLLTPNTFTGNVNVNGGILVARGSGDGAFGNAGNLINLNDGTIRITTAGWTSSRSINLTGNATFESATVSGITLNGPIGGSGALNKIGSNGLTMTAFNFYGGPTNLHAGTMTISGTFGSIPSTSAVSLRNTLTLDSSGGNAITGDRINNVAGITLLGGGLAMIGSGAAATSETVGATTFSRGISTVTVTPGTGRAASIAMGVVSRELGGAAFFRGTSLGATPGVDVANITLAASPPLVGGGGGPGSTTISIFPWAFGNTGATAAMNAVSNSFMTVGANGVRPLDTGTEYTGAIVPGTVTANNVRITNTNIFAVPTTINSLVVAAGIDLSGGGELTISSGGLLNLTNGFTINNPLNFGTAEAMILAPSSISFNGVISGSGGLTKQGAGVATFAASNTYAGTTVIGGGTAAFTGSVLDTVAGPFGNDASPVVLAPAGLGTGGTTARLVYAGAVPGQFNRALNVSGRIALNNPATVPGFGTSSATTLDMNGDITLDASPLTIIGTTGSTINLNGDISGTGMLTDNGAGSALIELNGNNSFSGGGEMQSATWELGSNTALGTGMFKMVNTGSQPTIVASGGARTIANEFVSFSANANYWQIAGNNDLTLTGNINLSGTYTHNINNSGNTTYAGVLHTGAFTKAGAGRLILSGNNIYTGNTTISGGVLRVTHSNALGTVQAPTIVASGAGLELANNALSNEPVTINGGGLSGNGAIHNVSDSNSVGNVTLASSSTIHVPGGALASGNIGGAANLIKSGAGPLTARRVRVNNLDVTDSSTLAIATGRNSDKTSVLTGALMLGTGSKLDLGNNDFVNEYTVTSPLPAIAAQIATAYNGGAWSGPGITSAQADSSSFALGYAESGDIFTSFPAMFSGIEVDITAALVRWTRYGDANLDGLVNISDYNRLAANFNGTGGWYDGDFNYDGNVNVIDFNRLAANYNMSAGADGEVGPDDWRALAAAIPEPGASTLMLLCSTLMVGRRRHRQRPDG